MTSRRRRWTWTDLRPWPMLAGAITCFSFAVVLGGDADATAEALFVIGAILVGAWIVLLTIAGHSGKDDDDTP